jgi:hypothetical protein
MKTFFLFVFYALMVIVIYEDHDKGYLLFVEIKKKDD